MSYLASRVHRFSEAEARRWLVIVCVAVTFVSLSLVAASVAWVLARLDAFERAGGANGVMAVIDKCGNAYEFTSTRAGDWQPDEALYFDKLESIIDCTRGLRLPQARGGQSCWLKVYPTLSKEATAKLNEELQGRFGQDMNNWGVAMAKHSMEIEVLTGSSKSDDGRYRLQWREKEAATGQSEIWSGTFAVSRVMATPEAIAHGNAIGLRIDSFTWQRDQVVGGR